jgi:hypothetical protein
MRKPDIFTWLIPVLPISDAVLLLNCGVFCVPCRVMYDRAVDLWVLIYTVLRELEEESTAALLKKSWTHFWSAHQRFFRQMLMAAKVHLLMAFQL